MPARIEYGTSSDEVREMQKYLNFTFGTKIPEDGSYGDEMAETVNQLADSIGYKGSVKAIDPAFEKALKDAAEPRVKVIICDKEVAVTRAQFDTLRLVAGKKAVESVRPYINMVQEAKSLWDAHDKARSDNAFWSSVVDVAVGTKFPPASLMNAALAEAKALESAARALELRYEDLPRSTTKIREAFAAMDQYREELFMGGDKLVDNLETIKTGCVVTLQIAAALGTGGLSWQVQVGVSAGVAAYEQALKEVTKASIDGSYTISSGLANTFAAAVVDGAAGYLLKGAGAAKFLDGVAKKAVEEAGSKKLLPFVIKSLNGGGQQLIKDGIKAVPGIFDPKKKISLEDVVKGAVKSFLTGAALKNLAKVCEKYGPGLGKFFDAKDFQALSKDAIDLEKAGVEMIKKAMEKIGPKVVEEVIDQMQIGWTERDLEQKIRDGILRDPAVIRAAQDAINDRKANKKTKT